MQNDDVDRKLMRHLQEDGEAALTDLAERAGVPVSSVARRIERLERAGVIEGWRCEIDWRAMGFAVEVSLRVTLDKTAANAFDTFLAAARKIPEIDQIQTFLGRVDVRLNVLARDLAHYQDIYRRRILTLPHIADIEALMLVGEVVNSPKVPL